MSLQETAESRFLNFPHKGMVALERGRILLRWKERADGAIIFEGSNLKGMHFEDRPFGELVFVEAKDKESLAKNAAIKLELINKLLATYRPHAMPDQNGYYAASAGVTTDGDLFIAVNNENYVKDGFSGRGCGESAVLRRAQMATGNVNVQFSQIALMSGMARRDVETGKLRDREEGHVACLCGECRVNLRDHMGQNGQFLMFPTNAGEAVLRERTGVHSPAELAEGEIWKIPQKQMYPLDSYQHISPRWNDAVFDGYHYITDTERPVLPIETPSLPELAADAKDITLSAEQFLRLKHHYTQAGFGVEALKESPSLENINRTLLQFVKKAYAEHAEKVGHSKNIEITVVLLKTDKGDFFPGIQVEGETWLPSKPPEMPVALSNSYNHIGISEVYMMTFNEAQLRHEMQAAHGASTAGHGLKMPDPAGLGRIIKNLKPAQQARVCVLPVNDGALDEPTLQNMAVEMDLRKAFGPAFSNPKEQRQRMV